MKTVLLLPSDCAGWSVWNLLREKMPHLTRKQYMDGFEQINLVNGKLPSSYSGRTIVVFGEACREAVGLPELLLHPLKWRGVEWRQLPHPSGNRRWYDDPHCRDLAALLLCELYMRGNKHEQEV